MTQKLATSEQVGEAMNRLLAAWCDRRCLRALRYVLQGWPMTSGLTDDWGQLLQALQDVRAFAKTEI